MIKSNKSKVEMTIVSIHIDDYPASAGYKEIITALVRGARDICYHKMKIQLHEIIETRYVTDSFAIVSKGNSENSLIISGKVEVYYENSGKRRSE